MADAGACTYRPMFKAVRISPTEPRRYGRRHLAVLGVESVGIQIASVGDQGEQVAVNPHGRLQGVPSALPAHPCQQGFLWQPRGF